MNLHEYQSQELFDPNAIPILNGRIVDSPEGTNEAATPLRDCVGQKSQEQARGRGNAGILKVAKDFDTVHPAAGMWRRF
jgi:succinyl-CoA synthetase beta subunit